MPVGRQTSEQLAQSVVDVYYAAETKMYNIIAKNLAEGIETPTWVQKKYSQMHAYRKQMEQLVADLNAEAHGAAKTALTEAYYRGGIVAAGELGRYAGGSAVFDFLGGQHAIEMMLGQLEGNLGFTNQRILREADDIYQSVIAQANAEVLTGTSTRLQATQNALDRFAEAGVTGFIDKAGRAWNLGSYAEMATRSGCMQASIQGHMDTLLSNGLDTVIVSADGLPCKLCAHWEGKVLSINPQGSAEYPTIESAEADGLFHPNCLHTVSAYQDGYTEPYPTKTASAKAQEAADYADSQKLRGIERQIRKAKRVEAAALDPAAKQAATAKVKFYQAKARALTKDNPRVWRQYPREQLYTGKAAQSVAEKKALAAYKAEQAAQKQETMAGWIKTSGKQGTNEGGWFKAPDGTDWYAKKYKDPMQARTEFATRKLYDKMGIATPESKLLLGEDKSLWIAGKRMDTKVINLGPESEGKDMLGPNALLGDRDWSKSGNHLMANVNGSWRVAAQDTGGTLNFRALGSSKEFTVGNAVSDLDGLLSHDSANLWKNMTAKDWSRNLDRLSKLADEDIIKIIDEAGLDPHMAQTIIGRRGVLKDELTARWSKAMKEEATAMAKAQAAEYSQALKTAGVKKAKTAEEAAAIKAKKQATWAAKKASQESSAAAGTAKKAVSEAASDIKVQTGPLTSVKTLQIGDKIEITAGKYAGCEAEVTGHWATGIPKYKITKVSEEAAAKGIAVGSKNDVGILKGEIGKVTKAAESPEIKPIDWKSEYIPKATSSVDFINVGYKIYLKNGDECEVIGKTGKSWHAKIKVKNKATGKIEYLTHSHDINTVFSPVYSDTDAAKVLQEKLAKQAEENAAKLAKAIESGKVKSAEAVEKVKESAEVQAREAERIAEAAKRKKWTSDKFANMNYSERVKFMEEWIGDSHGYKGYSSSKHFLKSEIDAIKFWKGSGYRTISKTLRVDRALTVEELKAKARGVTIRRLDIAMKKSPRLPHDIEVRRGLGHGGGKTFGLKAGDEFVDYSYVATGWNPNWSWGGGDMAVIRVPKEAKAICIDGNAGETEILLGRACKFKVTKIELSGGHRTFYLDLVEQDGVKFARY